MAGTKSRRAFRTKTNLVLGFIFLFISILGPKILNGQSFHNRDEFKKYLFDNLHKIDSIEGIWKGKHRIIQNFISDYGGVKNVKDETQDVEFLIINENNRFVAYSISMEQISKEKYFLQKTADRRIYLLSFPDYYGSDYESSAILTTPYSLETRVSNKHYSKKNQGTWTLGATMTLTKISLNDNEIREFLRNKPTLPEKNKTQEKVSGTGFLIGDGYIVTAAHVVDGFDQIHIRGIGGDFTKRYYCMKYHIDNDQDIAILQVLDYPYPMGKKLPYAFRSSKLKTGESVFCLGYPLRFSMGDDVKLTNGIISSLSGFQGNPMQYQITAPVQPGNSGGPLFDKNGNLVGIITAKHSGAENASYALKALSLQKLTIKYPSISSLPKLSKLVNMSLSAQFSLIQNYIYIVESEN